MNARPKLRSYKKQAQTHYDDVTAPGPKSYGHSGYGHSGYGHSGYQDDHYGHSGYGHDDHGYETYHSKDVCCPPVIDILTLLALLGGIAAATFFLNTVITMNIMMGRRKRSQEGLSEDTVFSDLLHQGWFFPFFYNKRLEKSPSLETFQ